MDPRRLARIRLVEAEGDSLREHSPLKENGPDPVIDKDVLTLEWFTQRVRRKKVPIKALLLDQTVVSGVGNWVSLVIFSSSRVPNTDVERYRSLTKFCTKREFILASTATHLAMSKYRRYTSRSSASAQYRASFWPIPPSSRRTGL